MTEGNLIVDWLKSALNGFLQIMKWHSGAKSKCIFYCLRQMTLSIIMNKQKGVERVQCVGSSILSLFLYLSSSFSIVHCLHFDGTILCTNYWTDMRRREFIGTCLLLLEWIFHFYFCVIMQQHKALLHSCDDCSLSYANTIRIDFTRIEMPVSIQLDAIECVVDCISQTTNYLFIQRDNGQHKKKLDDVSNVVSQNKCPQ